MAALTGDRISVRVMLPAALADTVAGARVLPVELAADDATVAGLLAELASAYPVLGRRLRDDTGALRRHVNVYVDGIDVRDSGGPTTRLQDGILVDVVPSIAGG
ncbi:MAG: MoaD/ThiS family protein [Actinomycetota bacterium]